MRSGKIQLIIGTRPEAIKMAPVAQALVRQGLPIQLVFTGQHAGLDPEQFGLEGMPQTRLRCTSGGDPLDHADVVTRALRPVITRDVDLVVVQGDTSSALGGARAAFAAGVPLAHVEAGLRSFDPAMPWPEEDNRRIIDAGATLLFAPTETSAANLRGQGVPGQIHVTGNTSIDVLRNMLGSLPPPRLRRAGAPPRLLVTCHRRENWGAAFAPIALALLQLARLPWLHIDVVLHPNPVVSQVMRSLLAGQPRLRLLTPMAHADMLDAMRHAAVILSDSGGIQEEAPALGVPLLILREKTERPEGITSGNMRLVGTDTATIVGGVRGLLEDEDAYAAMAHPALPFGDGHAADRICQLVQAYLTEQSLIPETLLSA
jgi:UDP-N-acetylglucosamine 2-epimerase (non-hydrolysing)